MVSAKKRTNRNQGRPFGTDQVDAHVGERLKQRRMALRLSQRELGELIGVSLQQIHKYETASNKVSLSRFFRLAQVLNVAPSYFYEEIFVSSTAADTVPNELRDSAGEEHESPLTPLERSSGTRALTSAFSAIKEATIRKQIYNLCEAIAGTRLLESGPADTLSDADADTVPGTLQPEPPPDDTTE